MLNPPVSSRYTVVQVLVPVRSKTVHPGALILSRGNQKSFC